MKKITIEYIKEYSLLDENICISEKYIDYKEKLIFICNKNHKYLKSWNKFQQGQRCLVCSKNNIIKNKNKTTIEEIKIESLKENHICISTVYSAKEKLEFICPNNHSYSNFWFNFKNGKRCKFCSKTLKKTIEEIKEYSSNYNYTCLSTIYNNAHEKLKFICSENHIFEMSWNCFQREQRCRTCYLKNNQGINHPNFNPNRKELSLNIRIRRKFNKNWTIKHMKDDPNYDIFLNNSDNYVVDHIIPIKLFGKILTNYKLNEEHVKKIINQRDNLQLLVIKENSDKRSKGSIFEACQYLMLNNIKLF